MTGNGNITTHKFMPLFRRGDNIAAANAPPGNMIPASVDENGIIRVHPSISIAGTPQDLNAVRITSDDVLNDPALTATAFAGLITASMSYGFDGTNWDRLRTNSATDAGTDVKTGMLSTGLPPGWVSENDPGVNVQATALQAPAAAGIIHVCTSIHASMSAGATASGIVVVSLRDGATTIWTSNLKVPVESNANISLTGLAIPGTAATQMSLRFAAAGGASTRQNVSFTGYDLAV